MNKKFNFYYDENAKTSIYELLKLAPVLYSLGNHENPAPCAYYELLSSAGVIILNGGINEFPNDNLIFRGLVWEGKDNFEGTLSTLNVVYTLVFCYIISLKCMRSM